jgi:branched-chain amino acid aminotransferase
MIQDFDAVEFLECIKELIRIDREWVPKIDSCSLYLRPTFIGTEV